MPRSLPILLIRVLVALVFVTEGVLKFLYPGEFGAGRFAHIGIPFPWVLGPLVATVEIAAGAAVLANFYAGDAAILLLAVILTALVSTKLPILLGRPLGSFALPKNVPHYGLLGFLHEARTDLSMLFCLVALLFHSGPQLGRGQRRNQR
jgi:putative oxidoreductase